MTCKFNYVIIIGGLNVGDLCKNRQSPKFTPRQYFILYGIFEVVYVIWRLDKLVILHYNR